MTTETWLLQKVSVVGIGDDWLLLFLSKWYATEFTENENQKERVILDQIFHFYRIKHHFENFVHRYPYGHFIVDGDKYFEGCYLKMIRSRNAKVKWFSILPSKVYLAPDEIHDSYIDFNEQLELDTTVYKQASSKS